MVIQIGSLDPFLDVCREFVRQAKEHGAKVEIEVYEGQPHAFFNYGQWKPKTVKRADEFLQEIGYLQPTPKVPLPPPGREGRQRRGRMRGREAKTK